MLGVRVELVIKNIELLCALLKCKQDIGSMAGLAPTTIMEVCNKGTHQDKTCGTKSSALEEVV